ncbi:DUF4407 domain-containing protein [Echinicola sediminis]
MDKLKKFLWFCSGGNFSLLKKCLTESNKYMGIGGTVFFTGLLAALSAGYALFTVFDVWYWAVLFAIVWGVMIFNLDRFIVSGMRKRANAWLEWKMAIPRIVLAILLALVISKPLELKIFEKEINRKIEEDKIQALAEAKSGLDEAFPEVDRLEAENDALREEVLVKEAFRDLKQKEYDAERFGVKTPGTTGIVGLGTNAKKKEEQLDEASKDLAELQKRNWAKIDANELAIQDILKDKKAVLQQQQGAISQYDGLAARMEALSVLSKSSPAIALANLFIVLLFVGIETAPVIVKLIAGRGPYDLLMDKAESEVEVYTKEMKFKNEEKSKSRLRYFTETLTEETSLAIKETLHRNQHMADLRMRQLEQGKTEEMSGEEKSLSESSS